MKKTGRPATPGFSVGDVLPNSRIVATEKRMGSDGYHDDFYLCQCTCGKSWWRQKIAIQKLPAAACRGCTQRANMSARAFEGYTKHPLYRVWKNMLNRCNNPNAQAYHNYGARGIYVCEKWHSFDAFTQDMLPTYAPHLSIERRDNNAGYSPNNCYWATVTEQNRNTRTARYVTFRGAKVRLSEAAEKAGLPLGAVRLRIDVHAWSVEDALTVPLRRTKRTVGA